MQSSRYDIRLSCPGSTPRHATKFVSDVSFRSHISSPQLGELYLGCWMISPSVTALRSQSHNTAFKCTGTQLTPIKDLRSTTCLGRSMRSLVVLGYLRLMIHMLSLVAFGFILVEFSIVGVAVRMQTWLGIQVRFHGFSVSMGELE